MNKLLSHVLALALVCLHYIYAQSCLIANCVQCPVNPYMCTQCEDGQQCCQS